PISQIREIVEELRKRLTPHTKNLEFDDTAARIVDTMLAALARGVRSLLPRRKQRALEEMEIVLDKYARMVEPRDALRLASLTSVFGRDHRGSSIDWDDLA